MIIEALNCSWHPKLLSFALGNITVSLLTMVYSIFCNFHSSLLDNTWFAYMLIMSEPQKNVCDHERKCFLHLREILACYYFIPFHFICSKLLEDMFNPTGIITVYCLSKTSFWPEIFYWRHFLVKSRRNFSNYNYSTHLIWC